MSWYDHYFTEEWKLRFQNEAKKQFKGSPHLIDDTFQNAWGKLFEKLQKLPGKDTSDALIFTTFRNLLKDEHRKHFGRCTPKAWVKHLGILWSRTAKELCETGLPPSVIAGKVCCNQSPDESEIPCQEQVEKIIPILQSESYCSTFKVSEEWTEEHQQGNHSTADQELSENELKLLINIILQRKSSDTKIDNVSEHILKQWQSLSATLQNILNDDDRILLTLLYIEECSVAKAARDLNIEVYTVRYQLKQTLMKIRQTLEKHDIDLGFLD